jgi:hypothetical protein
MRRAAEATELGCCRVRDLVDGLVRALRGAFDSGAGREVRRRFRAAGKWGVSAYREGSIHGRLHSKKVRRKYNERDAIAPATSICALLRDPTIGVDRFSCRKK